MQITPFQYCSEITHKHMAPDVNPSYSASFKNWPYKTQKIIKYRLVRTQMKNVFIKSERDLSNKTLKDVL